MEKTENLEGTATIKLDDDGILSMKMAPKSNIDLDAAKKIAEAASKLSGDTIHANLVDIRDMTFMSSDARKHFGGQDKSTVKAVAVLANNTLNRPLVNLYLKFSSPKLPTRFFDDEEKARSWLKEALQ